MSKRRKRLRIVGGVLGFFVLYSATAFIVSWNSPDAKLERTLDAIIAENGFRFKVKMVSSPGPDQVDSDIFGGGPISQEHKEQILAQLKEACPSCTVDVRTFGQDMRPVTAQDSEPTFDIYYVYPHKVASVLHLIITFDDKGLNINDDSPSSSLSVARSSEESSWSFLKKLWPW